MHLFDDPKSGAPYVVLLKDPGASSDVSAAGFIRSGLKGSDAPGAFLVS